MPRKVPGLSPQQPALRQRGLWRVYYNQRYQRFVVAAWPRGHGTDSPARKEARAQFKTANRLIKYATPEDVAAARGQTQATPYLPRDYLMKAAYGTLIDAFVADGRLWRSLRMAASEIQPLLDSITSEPGAILVRLTDAWYGLAPGDVDEVLTINAITGLPQWQPVPTPPPSSPPFMLPWRSGLWYGPPTQQNGTAFTATALRLYATPIYVPALTTIAKIGLHQTSAGSANVRLGVYADADGAPGALEFDSGSLATSGAGDHAASVNWQLQQGWHWLAAVTDTALGYSGLSAAALMSAWVGAAAITQNAGACYTQTLTSLTLPATFGGSYQATTAILVMLSPP